MGELQFMTCDRLKFLFIAPNKVTEAASNGQWSSFPVTHI